MGGGYGWLLWVVAMGGCCLLDAELALGIRCHDTSPGLASPTAAAPPPINRWSQSLDNLNLGDFGEASA